MNPSAGYTDSDSRKDAIASWGIAAIFGLIIVIAIVLTFLRPLPEPEQPTPPEAAVLKTVATEKLSCENLMDRALLISEDSCQRIDSNSVCYGNDNIDAELAPGTEGEFVVPGDVVAVNALESLYTLPLDVSSEEWGIAVFKLQAMLPETVPGQNVTFIVYGNTSLDNASGDMQAFYFSSGLGTVNCAIVPLDGVFIETPDGTGLVFTVNGTEVALMGRALLGASAGEQMTLSMLEGSAAVTADGEQQFIGAGQGLTVPLGGENSVEATGSPSEPFDLSDALLDATCALTGLGCDGELVIVSIEDAQAAIEDALDALNSGGGTADGTDGGGGQGNQGQGNQGSGGQGNQGQGNQGGGDSKP